MSSFPIDCKKNNKFWLKNIWIFEFAQKHGRLENHKNCIKCRAIEE